MWSFKFDSMLSFSKWNQSLFVENFLNFKTMGEIESEYSSVLVLLWDEGRGGTFSYNNGQLKRSWLSQSVFTRDELSSISCCFHPHKVTNAVQQLFIAIYCYTNGSIQLFTSEKKNRNQIKSPISSPITMSRSLECDLKHLSPSMYYLTIVTQSSIIITRMSVCID